MLRTICITLPIFVPTYVLKRMEFFLKVFFQLCFIYDDLNSFRDCFHNNVDMRLIKFSNPKSHCGFNSK